MATDPLTPAELIAAGEGIYGSGWKPALARDLGMSDSSLARMATGKTRIPDSFREEIAAIADRRGEQCRAVAARLRQGRP